MRISVFLLAGSALAFGSSHALELKVIGTRSRPVRDEIITRSKASGPGSGKENRNNRNKRKHIVKSNNRNKRKQPRVREVEELCSICQDPLSNDRPSEVTTTSCCRNRFHTACIKKLAVRHSTCPLCRHDIVGYQQPLAHPHPDECATWPSFRDKAIKRLEVFIDAFQTVLHEQNYPWSYRFHWDQLHRVLGGLAIIYSWSQLFGTVILLRGVYTASKAYRQRGFRRNITPQAAAFLRFLRIKLEEFQEDLRTLKNNYDNREYWIQKMRDNPQRVDWVSADENLHMALHAIVTPQVPY